MDYTVTVPTGKRLDDGHPTVISIAGGANLWEKAVTPPGMDGGGANETTTMHNISWRTNVPKHLRTMTDTSFTAAYSVGGFTTLVTSINDSQLVTITFGDGSQCRFYGWLNSFQPSENTEGAQPTASCTLIAANQDAYGNEIAPVYESPTDPLIYNPETGQQWQYNYTAPTPPAYNPLIHTYNYMTAKEYELRQRIREGKENPNVFKMCRSGIDTLALYDAFDIGDVRQKIRDYFKV
jgi:hypothetical protein